MTERFTYEVRPHTPIKELVPGRLIIKPTTTQLTKEEVLICMKHGPVYRVFPGKLPIRVLGSNLDELHTSEISGSKNINKASNHTINLNLSTREQEGVSNEPKTEEVTEPISTENITVAETEEIKEEVVEEEIVSNQEPEIEPEEVQVSLPEENENNVEKVTVEETIEEPTDIEEEEDLEELEDDSEEIVDNFNPNVINVNNNYKYHKKNKKH